MAAERESGGKKAPVAGRKNGSGEGGWKAVGSAVERVKKRVCEGVLAGGGTPGLEVGKTALGRVLGAAGFGL